MVVRCRLAILGFVLAFDARAHDWHIQLLPERRGLDDLAIDEFILIYVIALEQVQGSGSRWDHWRCGAEVDCPIGVGVVVGFEIRTLNASCPRLLP